MTRTIIEIPDALLREVDSVCRLLGVSRAEAVRRALRDYLRNSDSVRTDGFALWAEGLDRGPEGREAPPTQRGKARAMDGGTKHADGAHATSTDQSNASKRRAAPSGDRP